MNSDRHIRRAGGDYRDGFLETLPQGQAWPKQTSDSVLWQACDGLCDYWGSVDGRAADLLERESDPRQTIELLTDWERNWGLPDPCYTAPQTVDERQLALIMRMTMLGAQSRQFFIDVAAMIGYTITISEYRPFFIAMDGCGDCRKYGVVPPDPMRNQWGQPIMNARGDAPVANGDLSEWPNYGLGPLENRYYWTVHVTTAKLIWFRCSSGQCGVDPHLRIGLADDLECLLNRWKPAHTHIIFDYSNLSVGGPAFDYIGHASALGSAAGVGRSTRRATGAAAGAGVATAAGSGGGAVGTFTGIYAPVNVAGWQSFGGYRGSYRSVAVLTGSSQGKIRLTVEAWCDPVNGHFTDCTHVSFGKWAGANADCTTTPVELTFAGGHGFTGPRTGASLQTVVSDAVTHPGLTLNAGDTIVVIFDQPTADATAYQGGLTWGEPSSTFWWFQNSPLETWNIAAPGATAGGTTTQIINVALIETTSIGPATYIGVGAASGVGAANGKGPPATVTGTGAAAGHGTAAAQPPGSSGATLIWADEFTSFNLASASNPTGTWRANNWWQDWTGGYQDFAGSNWNINPNDPNFTAYNPYSQSGSVLTIQSFRTPSALVPYIRAILDAQGNTGIAVPAWCGGQLQLNRDFRTFIQPCYVEYRARWPIQGKGMFPALWMYATAGGAEPQSKGQAEIDMVEINSQTTSDWFNTNVHQRNTDGSGYDSGGYGPAYFDTHNWHTYGIDRQADHLDFYYDNTLLYHISGADAAWFNDVEMAIMLNFAMDAYWFWSYGLQSDGTSPSPMTMEVDYVRVYTTRPF